jgi:hypothetical protein
MGAPNSINGGYGRYPRSSTISSRATVRNRDQRRAGAVAQFDSKGLGFADKEARLRRPARSRARLNQQSCRDAQFEEPQQKEKISQKKSSRSIFS